MKFLSNLKIKQNLMMLVFIPAFALMYHTITKGLEDYNKFNSNKVAENSVEISVSIASLIHELQKERGLTAGFVSSNGKKFRNRLATQREIVNKKIKMLKELKREKVDNINVKFLKKLDSVLNRLNKINSIRKEISNLTIEKGRALKFYTTLNNEFISAISTILENMTEAKIANELSSYIAFLKAKDNVGIIRAVGTGVYASKIVTIEDKIKLSSLTSSQNALFYLFKNLASEKIKREFDKVENSTVNKKVKSYVNAILSAKSSNELKIDGQTFFLTVTEKLKSLKKLENLLSKEIIESTTEIVKASKINLLFNGVLDVLILLLALVVGYMVNKNITSNIKILEDYMKNISETNDLTQRCQLVSKDEIGNVAEALNGLIESFEKLVSEVKLSSVENTSIAQELSTTATGVGASVEDSVKIVNDTTKLSEDVKERIEVAMEEAEASKKDVLKAKEDLEIAKSEIIRLTSEVQRTSMLETELSDKMQTLSSEADQVKNILDVISDIADQTNLLALNAAIEAARAGEHGRGFAVVADEVRMLAERTQKSLSEINATINVIVQSITDVSSQMYTNSQDTQKLSELSSSVEVKIEETVEAIDIAANASQSTVKTFEDTKKDIENMASKIGQINDISSKNARSVEEIAAAAEHLNSMTSKLHIQLETFRTH
ncbi:methyl-accepting chemotaxis protein [Hydrogenimonas thermophila]|uniref:methyl-accepting chemotaxis protein n=1 Tax=Hydrogenimonas thermophila TaxID=223786 RepID=UPI0029372D17|nr:methyl-accepting chemotaxis protein [Hydrogenimonas thermophila]WOE70710.1 methyl-accepting chemotaxis protein [Hydrogenimonas thermophila]WOE73228.1 methyl-accepting chemotaxis protein [Hydrogenimonas thermophila]